MSDTSQKLKVLEHLKGGFSITALEALEKFGCMRLASIIHKLRKEGYSISTWTVKKSNGKHWAEYKMTFSDRMTTYDRQRNVVTPLKKGTRKAVKGKDIHSAIKQAEKEWGITPSGTQGK